MAKHIEFTVLRAQGGWFAHYGAMRSSSPRSSDAAARDLAMQVFGKLPVALTKVGEKQGGQVETWKAFA